MPTKRYFIVLSLAVIYLLVASLQVILIILSALFSESEAATQVFSRMTFSGYAFLIFQLMVSAYFVKRLYLLIVKKRTVIDGDHNGDMTWIQKVSVFFLNIGYIVLSLSMLGLAYMLVFVSAGGMSGVPFGLGLMLAGFLFCLSIITMELGSFVNRKQVLNLQSEER